MKRHITVGICIPSGHLWEADFAMCLINLFAHVLLKPMPGVRQIMLKLFNERSSLLPKTRQGLLDKAIAQQCDYALFIDTDQTFPSNLLYALLRHDKDVVACNIVTKSIPASPTARTFNVAHPGGDPVFTDPESKHLQEVWRVGTGIMLIKLDCLKEIPRPWFGVDFRHAQDEFVGEDWFFCERLQEHGVRIYVDHAISQEVGHVGKLIYTHDLVGSVVKEPINPPVFDEKTPGEIQHG